ncbi:hypothetical protein CCR96_14180 [Halochromatium roseum]|nr:hypothetical protein [Halochromatium roseum]
MVTMAISISAAPYAAFIGYQIIYFMYHNSRWWYPLIPDISYSFIFSTLLVALAIFTSKKGDTRLLQVPAFRWMILLVVMFALTYFWASSQPLHLIALDDYVKAVVIVFAAYTLCTSSKALNAYIWGYIASAAYIGYYGWHLGRTSAGRLDSLGTVDSPEVNGIAAATLPAAILALHKFWTARSHLERAASVVCGAFLVNGLVLMNSRGAFLGMAVGSAYYLYALYRTPGGDRSIKPKVMGLAIAGALSLVVVLDESAINRFMTIFEQHQPTVEEETGATRIFFWKAAIRMSYDYPFGKGYRGFFLESIDYIPGYIAGGGRRRAVHSTWLEVLTQTGYIGLFFFVSMLTASWLQLRAVKKSAIPIKDIERYYLAAALQAALISFLVASTFIDRMRAEVLYWLILFAACAYRIYLRPATPIGPEHGAGIKASRNPAGSAKNLNLPQGGFEPSRITRRRR